VKCSTADSTDGLNRAGRRLAARGKSPYVTQVEAAEYLGVTDRTIRNMVADGWLRAYKLGDRVIRLRLDEIEAAMRPIGALT
jgi:excisionase family DNA binding protein